MIARRRALAAVAALAAGVASAQTPPSPLELVRYAGLHAAAARDDAAEITRLIAAVA